MCAPEGNSEFCFPESLNVSRDEVEGNIETRNVPETKSRETLRLEGKQNSLFPEGVHIKCFVICRHFVYLFTQPVEAGNNCSLIALGIHCIYLKSRDHESANHV